MREWQDEQTGRTVRQLTDNAAGTELGYFRVPRRLPDGRVLAQRRGKPRTLVALDIETGAQQVFDQLRGWPLGLREADGRYWFCHEREVYAADLPDGIPQKIGELPPDTPLRMPTISCDGQTLITGIYTIDSDEEYVLPSTPDPAVFWRWVDRPRHGHLQAYNLQDGISRMVVALEKLMPIHTDASPTDSGLLKFAHDGFDAHCQRIWTVRTDGSGLTPIRVQEYGEMITHEFWWPGGQSIAYKFQDRRNDSTVHDLPWAEYAPVATRFGLANLRGEEYYLSDPLNHYHSHINVSPDGKMLCGEGTDGHSFLYAAAFSPHNTRIEFLPHASTHTPYQPFVGQNVNSSFSHDSQWIAFNDTIEGTMQVCAVRVEL